MLSLRGISCLQGVVDPDTVGASVTAKTALLGKGPSGPTTRARTPPDHSPKREQLRTGAEGRKLCLTITAVRDNDRRQGEETITDGQTVISKKQANIPHPGQRGGTRGVEEWESGRREQLWIQRGSGHSFPCTDPVPAHSGCITFSSRNAGLQLHTLTDRGLGPAHTEERPRKHQNAGSAPSPRRTPSHREYQELIPFAFPPGYIPGPSASGHSLGTGEEFLEIYCLSDLRQCPPFQRRDRGEGMEADGNNIPLGNRSRSQSNDHLTDSTVFSLSQSESLWTTESTRSAWEIYQYPIILLTTGGAVFLCGFVLSGLYFAKRDNLVAKILSPVLLSIGLMVLVVGLVLVPITKENLKPPMKRPLSYYRSPTIKL
ncbi:hypothetical protein JZ751_013074 [Albula glossodonta]|uniref:Phosphoinositide-interacting protein n=1 Tax=Albula glossodonta TaxID=121402 RepID=A0A8T2NW06_9TELE|nr:hypothetical protein JZ751_013074 [Albula glossodonta]